MLGWYSTGPRLRGNDLDINDMLARYCTNPLLVICEVQVRLQRSCLQAAQLPGCAGVDCLLLLATTRLCSVSPRLIALSARWRR